MHQFLPPYLAFYRILSCFCLAQGGVTHGYHYNLEQWHKRDAAFLVEHINTRPVDTFDSVVVEHDEIVTWWAGG